MAQLIYSLVMTVTNTPEESMGFPEEIPNRERLAGDDFLRGNIGVGWWLTASNPRMEAEAEGRGRSGSSLGPQEGFPLEDTDEAAPGSQCTRA